MRSRWRAAYLLKRAVELRITPKPRPKRCAHEARAAITMTLDKILNPTEVPVLKRRDTELLLKKMRKTTRTDSRSLSELGHAEVASELRLTDGARALNGRVKARRSGAPFGGARTQGVKEGIPELLLDQRSRSEPKFTRRRDEGPHPAFLREEGRRGPMPRKGVRGRKFENPKCRIRRSFEDLMRDTLGDDQEFPGPHLPLLRADLVDQPPAHQQVQLGSDMGMKGEVRREGRAEPDSPAIFEFGSHGWNMHKFTGSARRALLVSTDFEKNSV